MFNNSTPSLSDIAAVTNANDGFGGNNGWWILIILFAIFGGWGNNGYNNGYRGGYSDSGAIDNYVLASDFATLQRQVESVNQGICSLGYDQLGQMNGINTNIFNAQTALSTQLNAMSAQNAACCCETKNLINSNFADLNYNLATQACNTRQTVSDAARNIIDNDNANYRALNDRLTAMEMSAKDDKIASLQAKVQQLSFARDLGIHDEHVITTLRPAPIPAYAVANPNASLMGCNNCGGYTGYNC